MTAYAVPSARRPDLTYHVFVDEDDRWVCTPCADFAQRQRACKHIYEVVDRFHPEIAPPAPEVFAPVPAAEPGEEMYQFARRSPRIWHPYLEGPAESTRHDHALMVEDVRVEALLEDLAGVLNGRHPQKVGVGRPTLPPGDRVFVMAHRAQLERSLRKYHVHGRRLAAEGKIAFAPVKTSMVKYLALTETSDLLDEAHLEVVAPYTLMERDFIIGATGFSPQAVSNWCDRQKALRMQARTGRPTRLDYRKGTEWYKIHAVIGRESHAIVAFMLTPDHGEQTADVALYPQLLELLLAAGFDPRYIIADNAYLSRENWNETARLTEGRARLHTPLRGRNLDPRTHLPRGVARLVKEFSDANPQLADEIERARNIIEGMFSTEKGHGSENRFYAAGSKAERENRRALKHRLATDAEAAADENLRFLEAQAGLYISRENEMRIRVLRQVLRRTVAMEMLYNRRISYRRGSRFGPVREIVPEDVA